MTRRAAGDASVLFVPGIGPERAAKLLKLGIVTVHDLLYYFPFRYEGTLAGAELVLRDGAQIAALATVSGAIQVRFRGQRSVLTAPIEVEGRSLKAVFFNQPYLRHQLSQGKIVRLTGKFNGASQSIAVSSYEMQGANTSDSGLTPIYRVTQDMTVTILRKWIAEALRLFGKELPDELPSELCGRFKLMSLHTALQAMHFPRDAQEVRQAKRRLIFEEFLHFQLRVQGFRHARAATVREPLNNHHLRAHATVFLQMLPFELTRSQEDALEGILSDLAATRPMHRLLQGDVGSGKTAVAFAAAFAMAKCGLQTAVMAPTTILASQHEQDARKWLTPLGIRVACLTGNMDVRQKEETVRLIAEGEADIVIGTHTLATDSVAFPRLRFVIADEQHRFGVAARRLLREKGGDVDVLQLSATPIPRTLALTLYGDVEISEMRELPPGRLPIRTVLVKPREEEKVFRLLRQELGKGRQAYLVAPRIDASDESDGVSAVELFAKAEEELGLWRIGLLHGGLSEKERMAVMTEFASGEIAAIVATSIVEVGVSISNATVMVIYGAERFGLATLHQLRGRVGRSAFPSHCVLLANPQTTYAKERLRAMTETQDGFALAEKDLLLRGPGEVLGDRQSGLPVFRVGDVITDHKIMQAARDVVRDLLASEDFWLLPVYDTLRASALLPSASLADS